MLLCVKVSVRKNSVCKSFCLFEGVYVYMFVCKHVDLSQLVCVKASLCEEIFPRASERRVLIICDTCSYLHILLTSHLHISPSPLHILLTSHLHISPSPLHILLTSTHITSHVHILSASHLHISSSHFHILHIFTSTHIIFSSSHPLISSSHLHTLSSSHPLISSSHLHLFSFSHLHIPAVPHKEVAEVSKIENL